MKIALFCTLWNEDVFKYYYRGCRSWAQEHHAIIELYACYGRTNLKDKFNVGEYGIFYLPNLTEFDGAIIVTSTINQEEVRSNLFKAVRDAGIPCVTIDYEVDGFSSIGVDQQRDFNRMVHHMAEVHHAKRICYLGGTMANIESPNRLAGFLQGMEECGLTPEPELVIERSFDYQDGRDVVRELLDAGAKMPDAFICANDDMAIGVCDGLRKGGYHVGQDICVSGYDDYFTGENYSPRLTTVHRPRESMIYQACEIIRRRCEGGGVEHIMEQSTLVCGETCGCNETVNYNHQKFRQSVFRKSYQRKMMSDTLIHMEENIIGDESTLRMKEHIFSVLDGFHEGHCQIMLNPGIDSEDAVVFDSYRDCTSRVSSWSVASAEKHKDDYFDAFILAPIHFLDSCYGYCVFLGVDAIIHNANLLNFTKSIGFAIENTIQKRNYRNMNRLLDNLYETDFLTGVYNRHGLDRYAEKFFDGHMERGEKVQVIFVDIDYLKKINDSLGHESGDLAICMVGRALSQFSCDNCLVFRYGGDEFLVLRSDTCSFEEFEKGVHTYLYDKQQECPLPFTVSASVGCVLADPAEGRSLADCIQASDMQMYEIKQRRHQQAAPVKE